MTPRAVIPRNEGVSPSDVGTSIKNITPRRHSEASFFKGSRGNLNETHSYTDAQPPDSHVLPAEGLTMTFLGKGRTINNVMGQNGHHNANWGKALNYITQAVLPEEPLEGLPII